MDHGNTTQAGCLKYGCGGSLELWKNQQTGGEMLICTRDYKAFIEREHRPDHVLSHPRRRSVTEMGLSGGQSTAEVLQILDGDLRDMIISFENWSGAPDVVRGMRAGWQMARIFIRRYLVKKEVPASPPEEERMP